MLFYNWNLGAKNCSLENNEEISVIQLLESECRELFIGKYWRHLFCSTPGIWGQRNVHNKIMQKFVFFCAWQPWPSLTWRDDTWANPEGSPRCDGASWPQLQGGHAERRGVTWPSRTETGLESWQWVPLRWYCPFCMDKNQSYWICNRPNSVYILLRSNLGLDKFQRLHI